MHGRLKVRTSAEEAIRKKKEQDLKAKAYRNGMDKIFTMRKSGELDQNLLDLSAKILSVNPDLSTLWNIRRECILKMTAEVHDQQIFERDMGFTEVCLQAQPKSYGAWHHRVWILENSPNPDWDRELRLCTSYLKKDERNCKLIFHFHCVIDESLFAVVSVHVWDYRRYVVAKGDVSAADEFEFCDDKIKKNFSNYSSWFYRSQLLPKLHPHETDTTRPISEEKLREELELVITAAFTDPNDSSAWFYQRWLLGHSEPKLDLAAVKVSKTQAIVTFTKPIDIVKEGVEIFVDSVPRLNNGRWNSVMGNKKDTIWVQHGEYHLPDTLKVVVKFKQQEEFHLPDALKVETKSKATVCQLETKKIKDGTFIGVKCPSFGYDFGSDVMEELRNQLESCNQLLEYEPDSKWTLLTASLLMRSIDPIQYHDRTLEYLKKLQKVDTLRAGYYQDVACRWAIESKLKQWIDNEEFLTEKIDLSNLELTTFYYQHYFAVAKEIDLQGNRGLRSSFCKLSQLGECVVKF